MAEVALTEKFLKSFILNDNGTYKIQSTDSQLSDLVGFEIPAYNYIALTYVTVGNGAGEIKTVTYKTGGAGGTIVATLTLTYNASDEIATITKT